MKRLEAQPRIRFITVTVDADAEEPTVQDAHGQDRIQPWLVLAMPVVIVLIGAWTYRWVQEDAFINFRTLDNLLAGHGPVYNIGEWVEVYSDPLWLYVQAVLHLVLPFISMEWMSVILGIVGTIGGVVLSGRAIQRLGESRGEGLVFPIGLLIFSVVAGVWEFATSGLEMGLVFLWIGLSFWLLVRVEARRDSVFWPAFLIGLGPLIRPELILMTGVFLVVLGFVAVSPGWRGKGSVRRRCLFGFAVAVGLPAAYQVFRMMYFGLLVANPALAKNATTSSLSQGLTYLWNFAAPYTLWLPLGLGAVVVYPTMRRWWADHDRVGVVVALSPLIGGILDLLYVANVGGDYMHARLALPGFCGVCCSIFVGRRHLKGLFAVAVGVIVVWSTVCLGWLRFSGYEKAAQPIGDERQIWIDVSGHSNPIVPADFARALPYRAGVYFKKLADESLPGEQRIFVPTTTFYPKIGVQLPAKSKLPFALVVNIPAVGIAGIESGPRVYIFDESSLADPIGSHTDLVVGRYGKNIGPPWMLARFGLPPIQPVPPFASQQSISAASTALACAPLDAYLQAITSPLSASLAFSNLFHSLTYTTMSFSAKPKVAQGQLCGTQKHIGSTGLTDPNAVAPEIGHR